MKPIMIFLLVLLACGDGHNNVDNDRTIDTTRPPLTDTLGHDTVYSELNGRYHYRSDWNEIPDIRKRKTGL